MKKIIFHLGFPRTGTTYLQSILFPKLRNINFLGKPFDKKNSKIFYEFEKRIFSYDDLYFEKRKKFLGKEIKILFKNKINLISHEGLLRNTRFYEKKDKYFKGNNYSNNLKRLYKVLKTIIPKNNIYFLIFLRKQSDLLPSYYSNFWKSEYQISKSINYTKFIENCLETNEFNFGKIINYYELYNYLISFIPSSKVKLIDYESFFAKDKNKLKLFAKLFDNSDKHIESLINYNLVNSNKKNKNYYYNDLDKFLPKIFKKKFIQTSKFENKILNFYKNSNFKLDKKIPKLNLKLNGYY
tara:strand:- start:2465 stop:3355 length:891 start_codon:yes stop_codon:yes gene_type:complete